ncbi:MAG: hypothetical protein FJ102_26790 [Deltaproteobacteria bacterium]|nr:hypothetical protein [Deltaproteobacteria bacterium]
MSKKPPAAQHLTVRALPHTLLFHDWTEALTLWRMLSAAFPEALALALMPNHPHVITRDPRGKQKLAGVMSGYARWRGHYRQQDAHAWEVQPAPVHVEEGDHLRRTVRYVLLNPCRGKLASDPVAWPLSNHRDLVGLGSRKARPDAPAFHAYVSADPTCNLAGSPLPELHRGKASLAEVEAAASAVLRMTPRELRSSPRATRVLVRAAFYCEIDDAKLLADWAQRGVSQVYRLLTPRRANLDREPLLRAVLRAVADPRFPALVSPPRLDLTRWANWQHA